MNKKLAAIIAGGFTAMTSTAVLAQSLITYSEFTENGTYIITDADKSVLLGIDNPDDYFLGAASQFSVFVEGDFTAEGSDCEGRLAAGGSANLGKSTPSYSVGAKLDENTTAAKVVIGGNTLQHFEPNNINFVAPLNAEIEPVIMNYMSNGSCKVYSGKLFDFAEQFALLRQRSTYLKGLSENAELEINEYYKQQWTVKGDSKNLNVLNLSAEEYAVFTNEAKYIELNVEIPEGSYLVINVPGTDIQLPTTTVKVDYTDDNSSEVFMGENLPVLYNLADAVQFKYSGSIQGSTLAPNADASGDEGGHVAGMTIAKSFEGGIQFGYSVFNPSVNKMQLPGEAQQTTTVTTTTTKAATTTTKAAATTTKSAATTTKVAAKTTAPATGAATTTTKNGQLVLPGDATATTTAVLSSTTNTADGTQVTTTGSGVSSSTASTETDSTTSKTETTTTTSSDKTTTTTTSSTTSSKNGTSNDSPKTGVAGAGAYLLLMASATGIAFASRKKEN